MDVGAKPGLVCGVLLVWFVIVINACFFIQIAFNEIQFGAQGGVFLAQLAHFLERGGGIAQGGAVKFDQGFTLGGGDDGGTQGVVKLALVGR